MRFPYSIIIIFLMMASIMVVDATYKESKVFDGKFIISYDIKADPLTPVEGWEVNQTGLQIYQIQLRDNAGKNRTTIEISVSGPGFQEEGTIMDLLNGFSNVQGYSRVIDGHSAKVATGLHRDGKHLWTVFSYGLGNKNVNGRYANMVLVYCVLPEESAGDLMNTLHIGKRGFGL